ncbi:MAG: N-acetylmuramoyl-L-alanine amidase [Chthoniobacterales bacterium]
MPLSIKGAVTASFALLSASALGTDWNVIHQQGREYVTFANVAQFYQFPDYTRVSRTVSLRSNRRGIRAQAGTSELYINGVRFFTDYPLLSSATDALISAMDVSKIMEPVLRPSRIRGPKKVETVVLDPGHGGVDGGASTQWGNEKGFALDVVLAARTELLREGFKVEMTRARDVARSLEERVDFANQFTNAVFISIHFNSSSGGAGLESYSLAPADVISNASTEEHSAAPAAPSCAGNEQDPQNIALTAAVHATILARVAPFDRGVRHARFHVLRNVKLPAVLLEAGFLSDATEGPRIATAQYRQQLGAAIAQGVQTYNAAVNYQAGGSSFAVAKTNLPPHDRSITEPLAPENAAALTPVSRTITGPSVSINGEQ